MSVDDVHDSDELNGLDNLQGPDGTVNLGLKKFKEHES